MLLIDRHHNRADWLAGRLHAARTAVLETVSDALLKVHCRPVAQPSARRHLNGPVSPGAGIDAALARLAFEAPHWKLRRLAYEDGEWFCCLTRQPQLPAGLDDTVEGRHEDLATAILVALAEVPGGSTAVELHSATSSRPQPLSGCVVCCDSFR